MGLDSQEVEHHKVIIGDVDLAALARCSPARVTIIGLADDGAQQPTIIERTLATLRLMGHQVDTDH